VTGKVKSIYMTDKGRVRQNNEDNGGGFENKHGQRLAIVADGMGGHRAGDVASEMTVTTLRNHCGSRVKRLKQPIKQKFG